MVDMDKVSARWKEVMLNFMAYCRDTQAILYDMDRWGHGGVEEAKMELILAKEYFYNIAKILGISEVDIRDFEDLAEAVKIAIESEDINEIDNWVYRMDKFVVDVISGVISKIECGSVDRHG